MLGRHNAGRILLRLKIQQDALHRLKNGIPSNGEGRKILAAIQKTTAGSALYLRAA